MAKPTVLVVGLGEVGLSLFELLKQSKKFDVYGWDTDPEKTIDNQKGNHPKKVNVLHICYRCGIQEDFVKTTINYVNRFKPELTIINSTVPPGTTEKIHKLLGNHIVHSPIRGMHENKEIMKKDLKFWTKYIGGADSESVKLAQQHFNELGLKTKILKKSVNTELAKLFSTTYRAWMIACFQELHRISRTFEADFVEVVDFLEDTHEVRFDRPVHFPGVIGGHCLISNSELLLESYNSKFIKLIFCSNEIRKKEMEDPRIAEEVNKVKDRVKTFEKEHMNKKSG